MKKLNFTTKILPMVIAFLLVQRAGYAQVSFNVGLYTVTPNGQIVVPVTVDAFNNIISCQGTIGFDPTILSFVDVEQMGLPGMTNSNFGTYQTSDGKLRYSWNDATLAGVNLSDETVVFAIRFNALGSSGLFSAITFVNTPTPLEVVDNGYNTVNPAYNNGRVTINGISSDLTLRIDTITTPSGSQQIALNVRVWNFRNMLSMQGTIAFDQNLVIYSGVSQFGLPGITTTNFGASQAGSGVLTFSWNDASLSGVTLADSSVIFAVVFDVVGAPGQRSTVQFINTPTALEFVDIHYTPLVADLLSGFIHITSFENISNLSAAASASSTSVCPEASTQLNANASGGSGNYTYSWTSVPSGFTSSSASPAVNPNQTTSYTVVVDDGVTSVSSSITVTVNPVVIPTVTSPTANANTNVFSANVTNNGCATLTARGICWGTSPTPTNCVAQGGTTTGIFTQVVAGLPTGTLIYYRGYATNSVGTGYSSDASFTTLSTTPAIIDWDNSNAQQITLAAERSFVFTNGKSGGVYYLVIKQDGSGNRAVTWPSNIEWAGAIPPTFTTAPNTTDIISFLYDGANYLLLGTSLNLHY